MRFRRTAVFVLLLGGAVWGQGRFLGAGPRSARPDAATKATVQDLYRQAREAINATPTAVQPELLAQVARNEERLWPEQSLEDFQQVFRLALALPTDNPQKAEAERDAVGAVARGGEAAEALEMARMADVPKAPLYDELIGLAGRGIFGAGRGGLGGRSASATVTAAAKGEAGTAEERLASEVNGLIEECQRADGSFPYSGAAMALRRERSPLDRVQLGRMGYAAAANETDVSAMGQAEIFLQAGHRTVPELDGMLESTLTTLLQRLGESAAAGTLETATSVENRLMAVLEQVDAARAEALAAQFPGMGAQALSASSLGQVQIQAGGGAPQTGTLAVVGGAGGRGGPVRIRMNFGGAQATAGGGTGAAFTFATTVSAPAESGANPAEGESGGQKFLALVAQAEGLWRQQPGNALALANQAAGMLDDNLWQSEMPAVMRLAGLYQQLGDSGDAERLLNGTLQEADQMARAADSQDYTDAASLVQAAEGFGGALAPVLEVYSEAARLDLGTTAAHAEQAQFVLLKPAVLARIALVGEIEARLPRAR